MSGSIEASALTRMNERAQHLSAGRAEPELFGDREGDSRKVEARARLRGLGREPSARHRRQVERVRLLRRPALRQRPAPLRASRHRLRQGSGAALPDDARAPCGATLRLGLPWPAGRARGREGDGRLRPQRHPRMGHRQFQRGLPQLRAALHQGMGVVRHPRGALGVVRERLQDDGPLLHGERHVGLQNALRQRPRL